VPNAWPLELILVRHGQSEGNEATARSEKGDQTPWTPEFRAKHSSTYRLTDKGILQAKVFVHLVLFALFFPFFLILGIPDHGSLGEEEHWRSL
jgi:hypothetical protein